VAQGEGIFSPSRAAEPGSRNDHFSPINVIVVAREMETRLYLEMVEAGGLDFFAPPSKRRNFTTCFVAAWATPWRAVRRLCSLTTRWERRFFPNFRKQGRTQLSVFHELEYAYRLRFQSPDKQTA
jgi:hypothetical protein